jgi:hypothetical protein
MPKTVLGATPMESTMPMPKGTIKRQTLASLRNEYHAQWQRPWPYDDAYLEELWVETKDQLCNAKGNQRVPWPQVRRYALTLMRESHVFE